MNLDIKLKDLGIELDTTGKDLSENLRNTFFKSDAKQERLLMQESLNNIIKNSTETFVRKMIEEMNGSNIQELNLAHFVNEETEDLLQETITKKIMESFTVKQLIFMGIFETTNQLLDKVFRSSQLSIIGTLYNTFKEKPGVPKELVDTLKNKFEELLEEIREENGEVARSHSVGSDLESPADKIVQSKMRTQESHEDDDDFRDFLKSK